jgi:hypothetical protein
MNTVLAVISDKFDNGDLVTSVDIYSLSYGPRYSYPVHCNTGVACGSNK